MMIGPQVGLVLRAYLNGYGQAKENSEIKERSQFRAEWLARVVWHIDYLSRFKATWMIILLA
jgi:hypothetical protein